MVETADMIVKIKSTFSKYKYVVPIIVVGLILLLWPSDDMKTVDDTTVNSNDASNEKEMLETQRRIENILSSVEGVGRVKVFLSLKNDAKITYASDVNASSDERNDNNVANRNKSSQSNIVTVRDGNGNETALVLTKTAVEYRGALVVCDGGDIASVRLAITNALSSLLSIGSDAITVMKMCQ